MGARPVARRSARLGRLTRIYCIMPAFPRAKVLLLPLLGASLACAGCATDPKITGPTRNQIIISVRDQKLTVITPDLHRVTFPISTSKFGLGDRRGSLATPTGELEVAQKVGGGARPGTVFHGRVSTGEVVRVDQPGRDAIVTRILALRGLESGNREAYSRGIYIHGTPEERNIGRPVSYGCIRMRSRDVIQLYDMVKIGAKVQIIDTTMNRAIAANTIEAPPPPAPAEAPKIPESATEVKQPAAVAAAPAPSKPAKKEWAGAPARLLAKQAAIDAKAKSRAANGTHPISNTGSGGNWNTDGNRELNRNAVDSL
jgi:hypothetical protein